MMEYKMIVVEKQEPLTIIRINRPEVDNKINRQAVMEISDAIDTANADPAMKVMILTGTGEFFCRGGQVDSFPDGYLMDQRDYADGTVQVQEVIYRSRKPIIAAVQGHAFAGGLSITEGCDLAVCGKDSRFGLTELQNGLFPMIALAINSKSIPKKRLFEIIYESKEIDAQTACDWHIVNEVVDNDKVLERAIEIGRGIAEKSSVAITIGRQAYYEMVNMSQASAMAYAKATLLNLLWTEDAQEAARAKRDHRAPKFTGR